MMYVNECIQQKLKAEGLEFVTAVEANKWTAEAGVLKDSNLRPGKPLRKKCRDGLIHGARKEGARWYIYKI